MLFYVWVACKSRYLPAFVYWACEAKCWGGHLLSQAEGQNTLGEKSQQHVLETRHSDKLLCVIENFVKIFVSATEFCHCNKSQKTNQTEFVQLVMATKFPSTQSNLSQQYVTATSHPTCTQEVICQWNRLLQFVTWCVLTLIYG